MASSASGRRSVVEGALLEYQRSPGKFALMRREPPVLFSSIKEVLQVAAGKALGGESEAAPPVEVQQAACFFIRAAMLHPSADHYALFGLESNAGTDAIRDRYRLMMRLMHPDFSIAGDAQAWPPDTAARVNRAYEVLSTAKQRREYDEAMDAQGFAAQRPQPRSPAGAAVAATLRTETRESSGDQQRRLKVLAALFGAGGLVLLLGIVLGSPERESLVQRSPAEPSPTTIIAPAPQATLAVAPSPAAQPVTEPVTEPSIAIATTTPSPVVAPVVAPVVPPPASPMPAAAPQAAPISPVLRLATSVATAPARATSTSTSTAAQVSRADPPAATLPPAALAAVAPSAVPPAPLQLAAPVEPAAPAPPSARPNPGVTLAEVHPLLDKLVQQVESGSGDRILGMLDREARNAPGAQALMRQYNSLVDGSRAVKVSHVQFRSEPFEGRLLVTGHLMMDVGTAATAHAGKEFSLQAEFVSRDGGIVMTRLARPLGAAAAAPRSR